MILVTFTKLLFSRYFLLIRGYYNSICWTLLVISNLSNYSSLSRSACVSQKAKWCWKSLTAGTRPRPQNVIWRKKRKEKKTRKLPYINVTNNFFSYGEKCELKCTCRCIYTQSACIVITLYFLLYSDSSSTHNCSWILKFYFLISAYCAGELGKKWSWVD